MRSEVESPSRLVVRRARARSGAPRLAATPFATGRPANLAGAGRSRSGEWSGLAFLPCTRSVMSRHAPASFATLWTGPNRLGATARPATSLTSLRSSSMTRIASGRRCFSRVYPRPSSRPGSTRTSTSGFATLETSGNTGRSLGHRWLGSRSDTPTERLTYWNRLPMGISASPASSPLASSGTFSTTLSARSLCTPRPAEGTGERCTCQGYWRSLGCSTELYPHRVKH
jgi:hypothetical protein